MDGKAVLSCMVLAVEAHGHEILTIEGLPSDDCVVKAFAEQSEPGYGTALQCGFCTPGFVMTARALLDRVPSPYSVRDQRSSVRQHLPLRLLCRDSPGRSARVGDHGQGERFMKPAYTPRVQRSYVGAYRASNRWDREGQRKSKIRRRPDGEVSSARDLVREGAAQSLPPREDQKPRREPGCAAAGRRRCPHLRRSRMSPA